MIIWAEGFDHYGTGDTSLANMLRGVWASFNGSGLTLGVQATQARTGSRSLQFRGAGSIGSLYSARRVLGTGRVVVGCAFGLYMGTLPGINGAFGLSFRTAANASIGSVRVNTDGSVGIYAANVLVQDSDPVLTSSAWHHIEAKIIVDNVVGEMEIRVNGRMVLHVTDVNFGSTLCSQLQFQWFQTSPGVPDGTLYCIDDVVAWDDTGDFNNDFLGPQRVLTIYPSTDEATQDWTPSGAATGHECIDENTPDDATTYIFSADVGDVSDFGLPALPPETANIVGIYIPALARLSDAGTGGLQVSLVSGGDVSAGPDEVLTAAYTYWPSVHETDPDTDDLWTKSAVEAAIVRVEKTS